MSECWKTSQFVDFSYKTGLISFDLPTQIFGLSPAWLFFTILNYLLIIENDLIDLSLHEIIHYIGKDTVLHFLHSAYHSLPMQGRKVLLAEDNLINQKVAQMMLTKLGMIVNVANNGQEAVQSILKAEESGSQFHCVLMDMAMPIMGGVKATLVSLYLLLFVIHISFNL